MDERWKRNTVTDNRGKPLSVWSWRDYELSQNVNLGSEGGWVFELTLRGRRVGLFASEGEGKRGACDHIQASVGSSGSEQHALEAVS